MLAHLIALALQAAAPDVTLAELERAYDQTCNSRIYGQFDDLCSDMEDRIKAYRRELKRRPRGNGGTAPPAYPTIPPPPRSPAVPDPATPSPVAPKTEDDLTRALDVAREAGLDDAAEPKIAADDAGATALAEEIGAGSLKPKQ